MNETVKRDSEDSRQPGQATPGRPPCSVPLGVRPTGAGLVQKPINYREFDHD